MRDNRPVMEDFGSLDLRQVRRDIGRQALKAARSLTFSLPDGRKLEVSLARLRGNLGDGFVVYFSCPRCHGRCVSLLLTPDEHGLLCKTCARKEYRPAPRVPMDFTCRVLPG